MNLKIRGGLVAALIAALVSGGAGAGAPTSAYDQVVADRTLESFAQCMVKRRSIRTTGAFLALNPEFPEAGQFGTNMTEPSCLETIASDLSGHTSLFRGAMYRALYIRDFGANAALPPADQPRLDIEHEVESKDDASANIYNVTRRYGDCVVREDAHAVRDYILAKVASPRDEAALQRLKPLLGGCLQDGQQLQFRREVLRGYLAEALYRLSVGARVPLRKP